MSLQPHQKRVTKERSDLSVKIEKLNTFIGSDIFYSLPAGDQDRLRRQLAAMRQYLAILVERIARW